MQNAAPTFRALQLAPQGRRKPSNAIATENLSTPPLGIPAHPVMGQVAAAFNLHRDECDAQASTTDLELDRLQDLLDDSMNRLAGAFPTRASDAEARSHEEARDAARTMWFVFRTRTRYRGIGRRWMSCSARWRSRRAPSPRRKDLRDRRYAQGWDRGVNASTKAV